MSQILLTEDTEDRRVQFAEAAKRYATAATLAGDRKPVLIESDGGPSPAG